MSGDRQRRISVVKLTAKLYWLISFSASPSHSSHNLRFFFLSWKKQNYFISKRKTRCISSLRSIPCFSSSQLIPHHFPRHPQNKSFLNIFSMHFLSTMIFFRVLSLRVYSSLSVCANVRRFRISRGRSRLCFGAHTSGVHNFKFPLRNLRSRKILLGSID